MIERKKRTHRLLKLVQHTNVVLRGNILHTSILLLLTFLLLFLFARPVILHRKKSFLFKYKHAFCEDHPNNNINNSNSTLLVYMMISTYLIDIFFLSSDIHKAVSLTFQKRRNHGIEGVRDRRSHTLPRTPPTKERSTLPKRRSTRHTDHSQFSQPPSFDSYLPTV